MQYALPEYLLMKVPDIAPSLKNMKYDGLAKKLASIVAFYKKYPSQRIPEVSADDPKPTKRKKS